MNDVVKMFSEKMVEMQKGTLKSILESTWKPLFEDKLELDGFIDKVLNVTIICTSGLDIEIRTTTDERYVLKPMAQWDKEFLRYSVVSSMDRMTENDLKDIYFVSVDLVKTYRKELEDIYEERGYHTIYGESKECREDVEYIWQSVAKIVYLTEM